MAYNLYLQRMKHAKDVSNRHPAPIWGEDQREFVRQNYEQMSDAEMASALGLSHSFVLKKRLGMQLNHKRGAKPQTTTP